MEMPLIRRSVEWSVSFLIQGRHGCTLLKEEACNIEVPFVGRERLVIDTFENKAEVLIGRY
jgi:hypothetical protein